MNKHLTKKGIKSLKDKLTYLLKVAEYRELNNNVKEAIKNDIKYCNTWTKEQAKRVLISYSNYLNLNYDDATIQSIIEGINLYNYFQIRSFDNSTTKNRKEVVTKKAIKGTRKELIEQAYKWLEDNKIVLNDINIQVW